MFGHERPRGVRRRKAPAHLLLPLWTNDLNSGLQHGQTAPKEKGRRKSVGRCGTRAQNDLRPGRNRVHIQR